jgi:NADPH:quinone reductase-like Zn-dependent oxidoreductase
MQRIQYHRYGGPDVMRLESYTPPAPAEHEVLVRVKAAAINPLDWKMRNGELKIITGRKFPRGIGSDFAGIVESIGSAVTLVHPGDAVLGMAPFKTQGAFSNAVIAEENFLAPKPASLSFEEAAALPVVAVTAWTALVDKGNLQSGQRVFINGALGGVGLAAVQIALTLGASVAGRVGPNSFADAGALGIDPVLDYTKAIPASLNKTFDIVFDTVGNLTRQQGEALLKPKGLIVDINPSGGKFLRSLFSRRFVVLAGAAKPGTLQKVVDLAANGKLRVPIAHTASLADGIALLTALESGRSKGKSVIVIN